MTVEEGIQALGDMFKEFKVDGDGESKIVYVTVQFPRGWIVDQETESLFNVSHVAKDNLIYFYADIEVGTQKVFEAIVYNVENNKQAQERSNLFNIKVQELKELFMRKDVSIDTLKSISFEQIASENKVVAEQKKKTKA